jgi:signal transduction histidine kinase
LNPQLVNINALVVSLSDLLCSTLGERFQVSTSLEPRLPFVLIDPMQLQNAVLSLALSAMPDVGGVAIETTALGAPDERLLSLDPCAKGAWAALTVADIERDASFELSAQLFDARTRTTAQGQGGELGLATVFGFVEQSGGRLAVEGASAEAVRFTIYLPQAAPPAGG